MNGDTSFILICTALVMLMTPAGLAMFYGGLSNRRNVLNTVGMSYVGFCVAFLTWIIFGYTLALGEGGNALIGSLQDTALHQISIHEMQGNIPKILFITFQGMFACIAVAIISGSVIERMKFSSWLFFSACWVVLVYAPLVHWIWGSGWMSTIEELDFAGGTVVHVNAGVAGLVLALSVGRRKQYHRVEQPSSIKLTIIGSALLWFGWFGFNAGSQLSADAIAANALLVTNVAACCGGLAWMGIEWVVDGKPTLTGVASGVLSGLVGITPAAGYVDTAASLFIGFSSGLVGYLGVTRVKKQFRYDDSLDAFGIHGLVGIWGSLLTGLFANPIINGKAGAFYGNPKQMIPQVMATLVTIIYSAVGTWIVCRLTSLVTRGIRIRPEEEQQGLDLSLHQESFFSGTLPELLPGRKEDIKHYS